MSAPAAPLADVIHAYGKAVSEGLVSWSEAIEYLTRNCGLTALGAVDVLSTWQTIHQQYREAL
jgi:hypothetical protein